MAKLIATKPVAEKVAAAILAAPIRSENLKNGTVRNGLPVPELVRCLKTHLPEEDHRWLHKGLTSQDVIDTSLMLALQDALPLLARRLANLSDDLAALSEREGACGLMAAMRMQAALPITTSDRIATWGRPVSRLSDQMPDITERMRILQWGGPVGVRKGPVVTRTVFRRTKRVSACSKLVHGQLHYVASAIDGQSFVHV